MQTKKKQSVKKKTNCLKLKSCNCQYTSKTYLDLLSKLKLLPSYSKKGYPYDNSPLESFNSTIKRERINRDFYYNALEARNTIFAYIEGFYNKSRQHSALGYRSPNEFELAAQNSNFTLLPVKVNLNRKKGKQSKHHKITN